MAVTFTGKYTNWGDEIVVHGVVTLTSIDSGAVALPGLTYIDHASVSVKSAASAGYSRVINSNSAGSSVDGWLQITSASSGGEYDVIAFGR